MIQFRVIGCRRPFGEQNSSSIGGLALSTREHDSSRTEELIVRQKVIDQKGRQKQRPQQQLFGFAVCVLTGVGCAIGVLIVDGRHWLTMSAGVNNAGFGRKKVPVLHDIAKSSIGDVVGRKREMFDSQQNLVGPQVSPAGQPHRLRLNR